ncbi:MAG: glycosyltransferase [Lentisphaerae bacterium]|nr:glycosyltransferase [Lentisphaerota bacterium]
MEVRPKTEAEQQAFYEETRQCYLRAAGSAGQIDRYVQLAGTTVRLCFAGPALVGHFTAALDHIGISPVADPDLTLCLWDSESTGIPMPLPPCKRSAFTDRGDIWGFNSTRIRSAFHYSDYSVNLLDRQTGVGIYWANDAALLPYWADSSPLRTLFHWHLEQHDCQLVHAAAVGTESGAVLVTGKGGIGKSTTALSCLRAGLHYLGDDYVAVCLGSEPAVYSLYGTAKLDPDHMTSFPELEALRRNPATPAHEKVVLDLHPHFAEQLKHRMPLKAIVMPRINGGHDTTFRPADPVTTRKAVCFTTMCQLPYVGRHTHDFFTSLCASVPGYVLELGSDLARIPDAISDLLEQPPTPRSRPASGTQQSMSAKEYPMVSVVMPVFNGERFVREAIQNIVDQEYPATEIIVVNDGSTDRTESIVRELPYDIRYFKQKRDGPASARNRGIRDTTGDLVAFLDVDDLWPEHNLKMLVEEMLRRPDVDVVRGHAQVMEYDHEDGTSVFTGNPEEAYPDYIGAGLYRKRVFTKIGLFDPSLRFAEDTDWYNRAREHDVPMERLHAVTLWVRRHGRNMTHGKGPLELNMLRAFKKTLDRKRARAAGDPVLNGNGSFDVSVVVPVFNGAHFLADALRSAFEQEHLPAEVIVVDDGSTDNTADVARRFPGVKYIHQPNQGVAAARNAGIAAAVCPLIALLDADDTWAPEKLARQVDWLEKHPESGYVTAKFRNFLEPGTARPFWITEEQLREDQVGGMPNLVVRRPVFDIVGFFDVSFRQGADFDWLLRAREAGIKSASLPQTLLHRRIHDSNVSHQWQGSRDVLMRSLRKAVTRRRQAALSGTTR